MTRTAGGGGELRWRCDEGRRVKRKGKKRERVEERRGEQLARHVAGKGSCAGGVVGEVQDVGDRKGRAAAGRSAVVAGNKETMRERDKDVRYISLGFFL